MSHWITRFFKRCQAQLIWPLISRFCTFTPCTTQDEFPPSWVTWELNSSKNAGDNLYLPFYDHSCPLYILQVRVLYDAQPEYSPLWVTWQLNFSESDGENSYLLFYDYCYALFILEVWVLYDAQPVFSVICDVRSQPLRKCQRQLISPVLRWFRWLRRQVIPSVLFYDNVYVFCTFGKLDSCRRPY